MTTHPTLRDTPDEKLRIGGRTIERFDHQWYEYRGNEWSHGYQMLSDCEVRYLMGCRVAIGSKVKVVRFGRPPASGRSYDYRAGGDLAGVSCYLLQDDGSPLLTGFPEFLDRPRYDGTATLVAWGPDGEPLVRDLRLRRRRP